MRSSISSFETCGAYITGLLVVCIIFLISIELWARHSLTSQSTTYKRVWQQYHEAIRSRRSTLGEPVSVLMVGNSLLLDGIDVKQLSEATSGRLRIYPVFLEATHYYDWLYGLRRMFREGARPQVLVIGLGMESLIDNGVRPDYSPMLLFDARDVLNASSDLGLDRTATVNLMLAHWSAFWDIRRITRVQILRRAIPSAGDMLTVFKKLSRDPIGPEHEALAASRLGTLRQLGEAYGAKVILLIPPMSISPEAIPRVMVAARRAGLDALLPVDPLRLPADCFEPDTIHLNSKGAAVFTAAVQADLSRKVGSLETAVSANPSGESAMERQ
jgi:hypothetical protein